MRSTTKTLAILFLVLFSIQPALASSEASGEDGTLLIEIDDTAIHHLRFEAFDGASSEALVDTGPVVGPRIRLTAEQVELLRTAADLRTELRAWNGDGELVLSQLSTPEGSGEPLFSVGFETLPPGTTLAGDAIQLQANTEVTGSLNAASVETGELRDAAGGTFFDSCPTGWAIRSINANGTVSCEFDDTGSGGGDNLGNHRATQNIVFDPQEGLLGATGGALLATGPLGGTWFAHAGAPGHYRFGVKPYNAGTSGGNADFVVDENGYVGIFREDPQYRLDVLSDGRIGTNFDFVHLGAYDSAFIELRGAGTPLIDFSNDLSSDFDMRLILTGDDSLVFDGGRLGIGGTMINPQYKIDLPNSANENGRGRANLWLTYSSRRYKQNIRTIPSALDTLDRLRGVQFDWGEAQGGGPGLGFIAEEVGAVLPELVDWEDNGTDAKAMSYTGLIPVLVEATKEQQALIRALEQRLDQAEARLCGLDPESMACG